MLLKAGSKWVGTPAGGCCPPLSLGWAGPEGGSLSLPSLFSLWPSVVTFRPGSSASPGGVEVPRPVLPSSGALLSISGGLGAVFKFLPPPSRQLPTSNTTKEKEIFIVLPDLQEEAWCSWRQLVNTEWGLCAGMWPYFEVWGWGLVHKAPPLDRPLSPPHQPPASWETPGETGCSHEELLCNTNTLLWIHINNKIEKQYSDSQKHWNVKSLLCAQVPFQTCITFSTDQMICRM